jgi:hypothetical protein
MAMNDLITAKHLLILLIFVWVLTGGIKQLRALLERLRIM